MRCVIAAWIVFSVVYSSIYILFIVLKLQGGIGLDGCINALKEVDTVGVQTLTWSLG